MKIKSSNPVSNSFKHNQEDNTNNIDDFKIDNERKGSNDKSNLPFLKNNYNVSIDLSNFKNSSGINNNKDKST